MVDKVNKVNKCKLEAGRKHLNVMYDVHYNDVHDRSMKMLYAQGSWMYNIYAVICTRYGQHIWKHNDTVNLYFAVTVICAVDMHRSLSSAYTVHIHSWVHSAYIHTVYYNVLCGRLYAIHALLAHIYVHLHIYTYIHIYTVECIVDDYMRCTRCLHLPLKHHLGKLMNSNGRQKKEQEHLDECIIV